MKNPFLNFLIPEESYLERDISEYKIVETRMRGLIFLLDYGFLISIIYLTLEFIKLFSPEIPNQIYFIVIGFYSIIFILIEHYFDATIFKILFNVRSISGINCSKLGLPRHIAKFILRPIAVLLVLIYLKFCLALILWIFGIQKPLIRCINGKMNTLWYDFYLNQIVTKLPNARDI